MMSVSPSISQDNRNRINAWLGVQPLPEIDSASHGFNPGILSGFTLSMGDQCKINHASNVCCPNSKSELYYSGNDSVKGQDRIANTVQTDDHHIEFSSYKTNKLKSISESSKARTYESTMGFHPNTQHISAATKIQAAWRGFFARSRDPCAVEVRRELRTRRTEQYITLICNELQEIKAKQESDKRLRELQTEAIRFMWIQIRQLQKKVYCVEEHLKLKRTKSSHRATHESTSPQTAPSYKLQGCNSENNENKKKYEEDQLLLKQISDQRLPASHASPILNPTPGVILSSELTSSSEDHKAEMTNESSESSKADMSSDAGRHDVAIQNPPVSTEKDNDELKNTVQQLQLQVIQLQNALLSFSDKFLDSTAGAEVKCERSSADEPCPQAEFQGDDLEREVSKNVSLVSEQTGVPQSAEDFNKQNEVSKLCISDILVALDSSLTEKELWSICEQAALALNSQDKRSLKYISLDTMFIRKDGLVLFCESDSPPDEMYVAPEQNLFEEQIAVKSLIFGLSVTLWSAADFKMKDDQAPSLSSAFEALLVRMSDEQFDQRAELVDIIKMCQDHHAAAQYNSLEACASLYAEACELAQSKKKRIRNPDTHILITEESVKYRNYFGVNVVDQLNKANFCLKPVSTRQLAAKPVPDLTPHDLLMEEISCERSLKHIPDPKVYSVKDLFRENPELLQRLNVLPGQQRRNVQIAIKKQKRSNSASLHLQFPQPPVAFRAELKEVKAKSESNETSSSVVLRWQPACVSGKSGNESGANRIVGYRIYVNGQPKGIVTGGKCRALLDGLRSSCDYRLHVCAVSGVGESEPSNVVVVHVPPSNVTSDIKVSDIANGNDIVERVLRRYGIQKSSFVQPTNKDKDISKARNEDTCSASKLVRNEGFTSEVASDSTSSCSNGDNITPRSKALLDQLKDELML